MTGSRRRSWWGWGVEDDHLDRNELKELAALVADQFGLDDIVPRDPVEIDDLDLPTPRVKPPSALRQLCSTTPDDRASRALGMAYRDVVRAFRGDLPAVPDVVALPADERHVVDVLDWCAEAGAAVVPYGGGTSVVGGVNPPVGDRSVVSLDTRRLSGVVDIDEMSRAARIRAGTLGPAIEDTLRPHGLTLRFFPQSFEFSTLGGWIATRAGGHFATRMTHIDDLVQSVSAMTPRGPWEGRRLPADGAGPSPDRLLLGSEGTLGIVTSAWMRLQNRPVFRASATVRFDSFAGGLPAVRALARSGLHPANCRLLDPTEAVLSGAGDGTAALLLVGFESAHHPVDAWMDRALELCRDHGGRCADGARYRDDREDSPHAGDGGSDPGGGEGVDGADEDGAGGAWRSAFLRAPYLRDAMVALGMVTETFETATTWDRLLDGFVDEVVAATREAATEVCGDARVAVRLTHVYPDGAAPYFTVVAPGRPGSEVAQWDAIKAAAAEAIVDRGGAITHHHAVGRDHRPWYDRQRPDPFAAAFQEAKRTLDPNGLLNPGVLIDA